MTKRRKPPGPSKPRKRKQGPGASKPVVVKSRTSSRRASSPSRSPRRRSTNRTRARRRPPQRESAGAIAAEVATWVAAVAFGLMITAGVAWFRAQRDVSAYLAAPPELAASTVWSAPMMVREGLPLDPDAFEADLLAAGFERVEHLLDSQEATGEGVGLFAREGGTFDIWTALAEPQPGVRVHEGRTRLRADDGVIVEVSRRGGAVLPPTVLAHLGEDAVRTPVSLDEVSRWVEPALLSMEDARFRSHRGVDLWGILRALFSNATSADKQGGSTLTQQLAKNLFLSRVRTIRRKIRELFFASALESQLTKDELLELYLSEIYLGQMAGLPLHGIEQAASAWFAKSAARLELHEAATIVGVIPAPNAFSPVRHPRVAIERRNLVLKRMHEEGEIDAAQLAKASEAPLRLSGLEPSRLRRAPYAVDAAIDRVEEELGDGVVARGVHIHTTIQPLWQLAAEAAVARGMAQLDEDYPKAAGAQVGLVAARVTDGTVVAMVGGRNYARSPFNRATDASRQVGSTIKPLTLVKALSDQAVTPATRLADEPLTILDGGTEWIPKNYDGKYEGEVTLRRAIEASRNVPAVHLARSVGMVRLRRFYQSVGLSEATALPSAALGSFPASPLEMAGAYTVFGAGIAHVPEVVAFVTSTEGEELLRLTPLARDAVDERAAAQAMDILQGVITSGTGARARGLGVDGHAGGKTGTTDEYRDAWFVGLTTELSVAVWVGHDRGLLGLSGSRGALPTWAYFIAASGTQDVPFDLPAGLTRARVCVDTGQRARNACPDVIEELFLDGTVPDDKCEEHGAAKGIRKFFGRLFGKGNRDEAEVIGAEEDTPRDRRRRRRGER